MSNSDINVRICATTSVARIHTHTHAYAHSLFKQRCTLHWFIYSAIMLVILWLCLRENVYNFDKDRNVLRPYIRNVQRCVKHMKLEMCCIYLKWNVKRLQMNKYCNETQSYTTVNVKYLSFSINICTFYQRVPWNSRQ